MSAVRYKKQLAQLEVELEARLARLKLLEAENSALKQKERALQSCISGLESGLSATRTVLRSNSLRSNSITVHSSLSSPKTLAGSAPRALGFNTLSPNTLPALSSSSSENDASITQDSASSTSPVLALQRAQSNAVLEALEVKEQQVQQVINQLGCGNSYQELYSSKLLQRATSDPSRAASFIALGRESRLRYLIQAIQRMALLLPKYGTAAPATSTGSAQQQLDALIDEVSEMVLTCGLLDPPSLKLDWLSTHLETLQYEPYPEGWWQQVAQTLELTDDQKAALKLCWTRVKANKAALTAEHEKLLSRLNQLRQQQHVSHKQFGEIAQAVLKEQMPYSVQQLRQRQQQLRTQLNQLATKQQQRQQAKIQQQQRQQRQQQQQQQLLLSPRSSQDVQYMELESELQEVERLLFRDLDAQESQKGPEATLQEIQQWLFEDHTVPDTLLTPDSHNPSEIFDILGLDPLQNPNPGSLSTGSLSGGLNPGEFFNNPRASVTSKPKPQQDQAAGFSSPLISQGLECFDGFGGCLSGGGQGIGISSDLDSGFSSQQQQQQGIAGFIGEDVAGIQGLGVGDCGNLVDGLAGLGGVPPAMLQQQQQQQQPLWMQPLQVVLDCHHQQQQQPAQAFIPQQQQHWRSAFADPAQQQQQQQQQPWSSAAAAAQQQDAVVGFLQGDFFKPMTPCPTPAAAAAAVGTAPINIKTGRSKPAPRHKAAAAAAAAAGGAKGSISSDAVSASAPAALPQMLQASINGDECASLTTVKTAIIEEGEMLLQISSQEHQEIERHLDVIKDRVKMQHFCQLLAFHNAFTKKQLAAFYVVSFPYLPDALSICEALDELGW